jgi:putative hydrolase of the HAD superfamily
MAERGGRQALTWVFDLDNTLHDAGPHIFPHINRSMTQYLMRHLQLDEAGANQLRERYWRRYGATMLGLMRHHGTDPDHFLWETHPFHDLPGMVVKQRGLRAMLKRLPGRKVVFSNAPIRYSRAVLDILGIADLFDGVFSVEHTGYWPKPYAKGFYRLFRSLRLDPRRSIMVEDSVANLRTAKRLGMQTVWVTPAVKRPAYVDVNARSVLELPRLIARLG